MKAMRTFNITIDHGDGTFSVGDGFPSLEQFVCSLMDAYDEEATAGLSRAQIAGLQIQQLERYIQHGQDLISAIRADARIRGYDIVMPPRKA